MSAKLTNLASLGDCPSLEMVHMRRFTHALFLVIAFVGVQSRIVWADVKLPAVIGSHMVLQRDQPAPVWGWAAPGENVTVRFAGTTSDAKADQTGRWQVTLPKLAANSQPRSMVIEDSSGSQIELTDILVGEVWFCTGPSNIFWPVQKCDNAEQEIRRADFPRIRFFTVEKRTADEPQEDCVGHWFGCSPRTVGDVSGIGYFFSRRIHQDLDVPVGLLQSAILLEIMIRDWRNRWALEDFPVGMVQPAPYDCSKWPRSGLDAYSVQREAQLIVHEKVANIGIASTMDVDAVDVLHFTNKQVVGRRLASWALAAVYEFGLPFAGPIYESMTIEGESVRVRFRHTGSGLTTSHGLPPSHFLVAGADGEYYPAAARIDGHTVVVHSERVAKPIALRFAFTDTAVVNLLNREGLPASLFRTDAVASPETGRD
jgi:sialate O-acetylesterase